MRPAGVLRHCHLLHISLGYLGRMRQLVETLPVQAAWSACGQERYPTGLFVNCVQHVTWLATSCAVGSDDRNWPMLSSVMCQLVYSWLPDFVLLVFHHGQVAAACAIDLTGSMCKDDLSYLALHACAVESMGNLWSQSSCARRMRTHARCFVQRAQNACSGFCSMLACH